MSGQQKQAFRILLIALFVLTLSIPINSSVEAAEVDFKKEQSYELIDFIRLFMIDEKMDHSEFLHKFGKNNEFIYWDSSMSSDYINRKLYNYYRGGRAGLLFCGQGREKYEQVWVNGLLNNSREEIGFRSSVNIYGYLYWQPIMVEISTASPAVIARLTKEEYPDTNRLLSKYFLGNGLSVETLKNSGDFSYGMNLYKVSANGKAPLFIVIRTNQGNHLGNTTIGLFYKVSDATKYIDINGK